MRPVRIETGDLEFFAFNLIGYILNTLDDVFYAVINDNDNEQVGDIFNNRFKDHLDRFYDISEQSHCQVFRLWEYGEQHRYTEHKLYQQDNITQDIIQKDEYPALPVGIQKLIIPYGNGFEFVLFQPDNPAAEFPEQIVGQFEQEILDDQYQDEQGNPFGNLKYTVFLF